VATNADQLTELQTELAAVKTAMSAARSGGSSFTVDGLSYTNWRLADLREERTRLEKAIQRLLRGGRGFVVDMSHPGTESAETDNTVYTQVTV
jgi:hypothetical protein